jgi:hypothetical protein
MPTPDFASVTPQFNLNSGGPFGQNGVLTYGRFYTASGGMVGLGQVSPSGIATGIKNAGPQGWPGIGATLVATGRYNVMHPPSTVLAMFPQVSSASGVYMSVASVRDMATGFVGDASIPGRPAATGITQIQVFGGTPTGSTSPLINPPTGTRFDLLLFTSPNNSSGLTQF